MINYRELTDEILAGQQRLKDDSDAPGSELLIAPMSQKATGLSGPTVGVALLDLSTGFGGASLFNNWQSLIRLIDALWSAGEDAFGPYVEEWPTR